MAFVKASDSEMEKHSELSEKSAITVISEIGNDVSRFASSKRLCSWVGLTPGSNESAGKKKSVLISRAGVYLKPALVEIAHCAVKSTKSPYYKRKYEKLVKRRGKKLSSSLKNGDIWSHQEDKYYQIVLILIYSGVRISDGEQFKYRNYYDSYFTPLMENLGLDKTTHCCRHTCISMFSEAHVDQTTIKKIVGHAGAMTLTEKVYTHMNVKELIDAINKI